MVYLRCLELQNSGKPGDAGILEFQQERVKVRKSFIRKFKKVLSGKRLTRFYQIDGKIDTMIDFDIARTVPLVN